MADGENRKSQGTKSKKVRFTQISKFVAEFTRPFNMKCQLNQKY